MCNWYLNFSLLILSILRRLVSKYHISNNRSVLKKPQANLSEYGRCYQHNSHHSIWTGWNWSFSWSQRSYVAYEIDKQPRVYQKDIYFIKRSFTQNHIIANSNSKNSVLLVWTIKTVKKYVCIKLFFFRKW